MLADTGLPPLGGSQLFSTQFEFVPVAMIVVPWASTSGGCVATMPCTRATGGRSARRWPGSVRYQHRHWDLQLRRRLRRRAVLGPHGPAPDPDHGGCPAVRRRLSLAAGLQFHLGHGPHRRHRGAALAVSQFLGNPIVAFILYAVVIPISHLTVWYNYTLTAGERAQRGAPGVPARGLPVLAADLRERPQCHRLHPALQFFYLFMAIPIDTFTGVSLAGATHELFPAYFATHRTRGPSLRRWTSMPGATSCGSSETR